MRRLGQHFLRDEETLDRIVGYGDVGPGDTVLEIGAGEGLLTERIASKAGRVIAVEVDESLAEEARRRLRNKDNVELIVGDILELDLKGFNKVISNPPYGISARLMEWLIKRMPETMVLTLQKEFVGKLKARPGTRKYTYISFLTQLAYRIEVREVIPRHRFQPPPKVDSMVTVFHRRAEYNGLDAWEMGAARTLFTRRRQNVLRVVGDVFGPKAADLIRGLPYASKKIYQLPPHELTRCVRLIKVACGE